MAERPPFPPGSGIYAGTVVNGLQYQSIAFGVTHGLSANEIQRQLAGTDLAVRRQALLEVVRELKQSIGLGGALQNTPYAFRPSEGIFNPVSRNLNGEKRVYASVQVSVTAEGQPLFRHVVLTFSGQLTRTEINNRLLDTLSAAAAAYGESYASEDLRYTRLERQG